jgi:hypothetical protein
VDELHRDEDLAAVLADLVDVDDVGVREAGERLGLAQGALAVAELVVGLAADELDRDAAIELLVEAGKKRCPCRLGRARRGSRSGRS